MSMSERLQDILLSRGVLPETVDKMNADKIDEDAIAEMTDEELEQYIPQKGDRVVVKAFAIKEKSETDNAKRKLSLLENLKAKMTAKSSKTKKKTSSDSSGAVASTSSETPAARENSNKSKQSHIATKSVRSVIVGFCIYQKTETGSKYRQVRAPMGGGIRNINISKTTTKSELLNKISQLFFPDGKNSHGVVENFDLDVSTDVHGSHLMHNNETVDELIERLGLKHLRCYLLAKEVVLDEDTCNSDSSLQDSLEDLPDMLSSKRATKRKVATSPGADSNQVENTKGVGQVLSHERDSDEVTIVGNEEVVITTEEHHSHQDLSQMEYGSLHMLMNPLYGDLIQEDTLVRSMSDSDTIQFGPFLTGDEDLNDTVPTVKEIKVHRGNVCHELIEYFSKEENINLTGTTFEVKMLNSNGTAELAEDNGGVMRDCLSEFYDSFYLQYATGNNSVAVPVLRHDMTATHWSAVAEVIRVGFRQEGIFPVRLALPFMQQTLFGSSDDPLDAFLGMVPDIDRLLLEEALLGVSSVDEDELLDLMERHEAKQKPTDANIKKVLTEMAHKEIVQTPLFVAECWRPTLNTLGISQHQLRELYANLKPQTKKVLKILEFPESMDTDERTLSSSVKQLVREMDSSLLGLFLRFCTGSNLMVRGKISVRFNDSEVCCPTSHTCGCVLVIPRGYAGQPYISFKSEFTTVLNNRYWQMDII